MVLAIGLFALLFGGGAFAIWWFYFKDGCSDEIPTKNYSLCATGDEAEDIFAEECSDSWLIEEYGPCGCGLLPQKNIAAWEDTVNQPDQDTRYLKCLQNAPTFAQHAQCKCSCDKCYKDYCEDETTVSFWNTQCQILFDVIT